MQREEGTAHKACCCVASQLLLTLLAGRQQGHMQGGLQGLNSSSPSKRREKCVHTQPCTELREGGLTLTGLIITPFAVLGISDSASSTMFKAGFVHIFSSTIHTQGYKFAFRFPVYIMLILVLHFQAGLMAQSLKHFRSPEPQ